MAEDWGSSEVSSSGGSTWTAAAFAFSVTFGVGVAALLLFMLIGGWPRG